MSDAYLIFALAAAVALTVLGARDAFADWRQGPKSLRKPGWWLWSDRLWRAWLRSGFLAWWFIALLVPIIALRLPDEDSSFITTVSAVFGVLLTLVLVLWASAALFARPKLLIPKRVRDDPSLVAEWFRGPDQEGTEPRR